MNIKQVDYFIVVAHHNSLSSAARECDVSVQALSRAMSDLEIEFGSDLLQRNPRGIALTPLGELFLEKAIPVSQAFHQLETTGKACAQNQSKLRLFLCAPMFNQSERARNNLAVFFDKYLDTETEISIGTGEKGMETIHEGGCDALITIGSLDHPDFTCFSAGTVPTGICMSKSHPLAQQKEIRLQQLKPYPVLSSKSFDHFNNSILVTYQKAGLSATVIEPSGLDATRQFYLKQGVAFMVNLPALGEILPRSVIVPIAAEDTITIPLCLITLKGSASPTYHRFEYLLKSNI